MSIQLLDQTHSSELYRSFLAAFYDNQVKLQPSKEEFEYRLKHKLSANLEMSAAWFDEQDILGFILHTSALYEGIPTAYNGGTGVLPGFRNQQIAEQLYEYLLPKVRANLVARIILEVVDSNHSAIKLYEKIGFQIRRNFKCYKQVSPMDLSYTHEVLESDISEVDFSFGDYLPSFLDSEEQLLKGKEKVLTVSQNEKTIGFLIFQQHLGRISQIAIHPQKRNERIAQSLMYRAQQLSKKQLTIMNIPEEEYGFHRFLLSCGFKNQVNQFEMEFVL